jgi:hypothetical protein
MAGERGPEHDLADALVKGLREDFPGRNEAALQLAELFLDATGPSLELANGGPAAEPLGEIELCATGIDVYSWDGAPGWDEVLAHGLSKSGRQPAGPDPFSGLGAPASRDAQRALCEDRAREEARRFLSEAKEAAARTDPGLLVSAHAALLRLVALSAVHPLLALPEDSGAGTLPPSGAEALLREMDERAAAGSDFASAQQEWLARLQADNSAAREPAFGAFFAGSSQALRLALALRAFGDAAHTGTVATDLEPLVGATGAWQPVRWRDMRKGIPAAWTAELFPEREPAAGFAGLARNCEAGLDSAGRLWGAKSLSATGFAALACDLFARSACALAIIDEL